MSQSDLRSYATWFHAAIPARIAELAAVVKSTPGYEDWAPNAEVDSLEVLGRWFEGQVETRKRSPNEIAEIEKTLVFPVDISADELTNRTFSLAMDIGMYFAQVVLRNIPGTHWDQSFKSRRDAEFGQPVIMGFGKVPMNPIRILRVIAYKISDGQPANLRGLYDRWAQKRQHSS